MSSVPTFVGRIDARTPAVLTCTLGVGLPGFEPGTFGPPDQRANQAAPQPVHGLSRGRQCRRTPLRHFGPKPLQKVARCFRSGTDRYRSAGESVRDDAEEPLDALHGPVAEVD